MAQVVYLDDIHLISPWVTVVRIMLTFTWTSLCVQWFTRGKTMHETENSLAE